MRLYDVADALFINRPGSLAEYKLDRCLGFTQSGLKCAASKHQTHESELRTGNMSQHQAGERGAFAQVF